MANVSSKQQYSGRFLKIELISNVTNGTGPTKVHIKKYILGICNIFMQKVPFVGRLLLIVAITKLINVQIP